MASNNRRHSVSILVATFPILLLLGCDRYEPIMEEKAVINFPGNSSVAIECGISTFNNKLLMSCIISNGTPHSVELVTNESFCSANSINLFSFSDLDLGVSKNVLPYTRTVFSGAVLLREVRGRYHGNIAKATNLCFRITLSGLGGGIEKQKVELTKKFDTNEVLESCRGK